MHARPITSLALITLLLAACAGSDADPDPIEHPGGDALVLRVEQHGGFAPAAIDVTRLPAFSLLGDGRVIRPGGVIAIYPGPVLPPLTVRRLNESGVQAVLREVLGTGLFAADHRFDAAAAHVADAPDTVFELHANGSEVTLRVYALGIAGDDLPDDEVAAYAELSTLDQRLASLESWLPASAWADGTSSAFTADALLLLIRDATGDRPDQSGIGFNLVPWPTDADPTAGDEFGDRRCVVVTGAEAKTWNDALAKANGLTRWTHGERRYEVLPVPILPDQPKQCPAA